MAASQRLQTAMLAAAATLAVAPVAYFAWTRFVRRSERLQALKLLHKVELIVAEVGVRLLYLANQAEDAVGNDERSAAEAPESTLNSYYHFDSHGNKLRTKWDSYDVDAELQRLEEEEEGEKNKGNDRDEVSALAKSKAAERKPTFVAIDKKQLLSAVAGIEREFEAVLEFLDDVRGDDDVKKLRKAIALKINEDHFGRVDYVRRLLAV
ncbi:hypothetical protein PybrP1_011458 [[Pythium] brassicae (nom. inval.)]|nr:hypothetical protein PybrP1_011458 [[Pythium] brassicae (nom. inval.)]